ncbi:molybdopterin-dependent oxidoreductase, partial [Candidatus Desantisbacteria bacterium]|nr:molybdopterin-dependent oxidoreductase [Candidatus Desantisbacteria bacterium]
GGKWIYCKPGTEGILFAGLNNYLIQQDKLNANFVKTNTIGYEGFAKSIKEWTLEKVSKITGASIDNLKEIAESFAGTDKGMIVFGSEISIGANSESNIHMLNNFVLLTGNIGRESSGVIPVTEYNNLQGAYDMGVTPNYFPGYQNVSTPYIREKFSKAWEVDHLSDEKGLSVSDMIHAILEGKLKALYVMGDNLVLPYLRRTHKKAMDMLEVIIVQDIYLTESAELATIVLPAVSFAEKSGTFTNTDRHIQKVNQAIDKFGDSKSDWRIIQAISSEMGYSMNFNSPEDVMAEIAKLTPIYQQVNCNDMENKSVQWPVDNNNVSGTKTLFTQGFPPDSGRFHEASFDIASLEEKKDEYLFNLIISGTLYHSGTGTMSKKSHDIMSVDNKVFLQINQKDAIKLGLNNNDEVLLSTPYDKIRIPIAFNLEVPEGYVFVPFYFAVNTNILGNFLEVHNNKENFTEMCPANLGRI